MAVTTDTIEEGLAGGELKPCPFCAEPIRAAAIKCKHCGEFLSPKPAGKWYFKTSFLIAAILFLGPFALPLVWLNPGFTRRAKVIITIIVLVASYLLGVMVLRAIGTINAYYELLFETYQ